MRESDNEVIGLASRKKGFNLLTPPASGRLISGMDTPLDPNAVHVLFVVEKPQGKSKAWQNFVQAFDNNDLWPGTSIEEHKTPNERLAENIWLLPLKTSMPLLGRLAAAAEQAGVPYKYLVFFEPPVWVVPDHTSRSDTGGTSASAS
jgi:hypothetical protein